MSLPHARWWRRAAPLFSTLLLLASCAGPPPESSSLERSGDSAVAPLTGPQAPQAGVEEMKILHEANALAKAGHLEQAIARYRELIHQYPSTPLLGEAWSRVADLHMTRGENAAGEEALEQAARTPYAAGRQAAVRLGDLRLRQGKLGGAWQAWFPQLTVESPERLEAWRRLLESYLTAGLGETTIFLKHLPQPGLPEELARPALATVGQQTQERLRLALDRQPANSSLLPYLQLALGDRLAQVGDTTQARQLWQQAAAFTLSGDAAALEAGKRLQQPVAGNKVVVGLLLPQSGRYTALGRNLRSAAQLALSHYPDAPITFQVEDSGATPEQTRQAIDRLMQAGARVVVGPVFKEEAQTAATEAAARSFTLITLNPHASLARPGGNVFLNAFQPEQQAEVMARHAAQYEHRRRAAILAPDSSYGQITATAFQKEFEAQGGQTVRTLYFPQDSLDFTSTMRELMRDRNATGGDFDVLFLPVKAEQARLLAPQLAYHRIKTPEDVLLVGTSLWNRPELLSAAADTELMRGAVFCDVDPTIEAEFKRTFRAVWNEAPSSLAFLTYDAVAVVAQLVREGGGVPQRFALLRPEGFRGSAGTVRFMDSGLSQREYRVLQVNSDGIRPWAIPGLAPTIAAPPPAKSGGLISGAEAAPLPATEREPGTPAPDEPQLPVRKDPFDPFRTP